jgi:hypothetical protein
MLAAIASLHIGIGLLVPNVTFFTLSMVCAFITFLSAEDVDLFQALSKKIYHNVRTFMKTAQIAGDC